MSKKEDEGIPRGDLLLVPLGSTLPGWGRLLLWMLVVNLSGRPLVWRHALSGWKSRFCILPRGGYGQ